MQRNWKKYCNKAVRALESVHEQLGEDNYLQMIGKYGNAEKSDSQSEYIKNILNDLSNNNSADEAKKVMRACGYQCMSDSLIDTMRTYYVEHNNLDSLIEEMNKRGVGGGNITRDGNTLTASYEQCYCEIDHKNKLPGCYCQCSCGWFEKLFVGILEQPVTVDLEKSIIRGDDECKFIITLSE